MENQEFKIGDVVQLKSGGPKMTVSNINTSSKYYHYCVYFLDGILQQNNSFHQETLQLVKE